MGRKPKSKKIKAIGEQFDQLKVSEPNSTLIELWEERKMFSTKELLSRLCNLTTTRGLESWQLHPSNTETVWNILGYLCDIVEVDEDYKYVAMVIEKRKLFNQFDKCRLFVLNQSTDLASKKIRLERLLINLLKATSKYFAIAQTASQSVRPNFFLDLVNSVRSLDIKPRIVLRLEYFHSMLISNSEENDTINKEENVKDVCTSDSPEPPDDVVYWNVVPTHRDIFTTETMFLRPNFIRRPYPDLETYKDVQFRLLMEDFMQPLRRGMQKLEKEDFGPKGIPELRIYENVTLKFLQNPRHLVPEREKSWRFYCAKFQTLPKVDWSTSRRLNNGSLVCLWDGTNEVVIATVACR